MTFGKALAATVLAAAIVFVIVAACGGLAP